MLWQPWYKYFSALVLLTLCQGLHLHLLQHYSAGLWLAPTESKIPIKLVLGLCHKICFITNATQTSALTIILIIRHICKTMKSFIMSVHQPVCMERFCSYLTDFHVWYLMIFWRTVKKIQFSLKYHRNNRHFTWRKTYFLPYLTQCFLEWKMFQTKILEKIKKQISCSIFF